MGHLQSCLPDAVHEELLQDPSVVIACGTGTLRIRWHFHYDIPNEHISRLR